MGVMTQTLPLFVVSTLKVTFNRLKILFASLEKYSYRLCDRSCYAWMGGGGGRGGGTPGHFGWACAAKVQEP